MGKAPDIFEQCPMSTSVKILNGKWKLSILWYISRRTIRFNELQRKLPNITQRTLTMQLRELERDGLIKRKAYAEVPPRVEYSLTELGETVKPILIAMCRWGKNYKKVFKDSETKKPVRKYILKISSDNQ